MKRYELLTSTAVVTSERFRLYDKIRVHLITPPNVALVGLLTPDDSGVGLNRKVSVPRDNVRHIELISPSTDRL